MTQSILWYEPPIFFYIFVIAPLTYLAYQAWNLALGWRPSALRLTLVTLTFTLSDLLILGLVRWIGWSHQVVMVPYLGMSLSRLLPILLLALPASKATRLGQPHPPLRRGALPVLWVLNLSLSILAVYSIYIEPYRIQISQVSLPGPNLASGEPLRIVHLTDLHIGPITSRETDMIEQVNNLQPDLILLTGDYFFFNTNNDPQVGANVRWTLSQLQARLGIYAITGSPGVDQPQVVNGFFSQVDNVTLLEDAVQPIPLGGETLYLVGVSNLEHNRDAQALQRLMAGLPPEVYTILLYHVPDMASTAAEAGVDLFLAGHTHGRQVGLPPMEWVYNLFMAYSRGLDHLEDTTIYVNRGIGVEGLYLPGIRFLCPPEIALLEMSPSFPALVTSYTYP